MTTPRRLTAGLSAVAVILTLTACAPAEAAPPVTQESNTAFPRTIEVPAGPNTEAAEIELETEPQAIAALGYETAEIAAELGLSDRLVIIPEAVLNPVLGGHVEELSEVPHTFAVEMELDAETVIALAPDLVLMSPRHGAETKIGAVLEQAGIPTLVVPNHWSLPADLETNISLIGEATGTEDVAETVITELAEGLTPQHSTDSSSDKPQILVLSNQAGRPFITAGTAFPLELLSLAGGNSVSEEMGMHTTGPITAEQVLVADPDGILLIDMNGSGERMFADLMGNEAVQTLSAVAQGHTMMVDGREVQALGLTQTIDGLHSLTDWVSTLK